MKFSISLLFLLVASSAQAFDLMKCQSIKHGTLWASFGQFYDSSSAEPKVFVTSFAFVGKDEGVTDSQDYFNHQRSLQEIEVVRRGQFVRLEFSVTSPRHTLQLLQYDARSPNAFQGNWTVTDTETGEESLNLVHCNLK